MVYKTLPLFFMVHVGTVFLHIQLDWKWACLQLRIGTGHTGLEALESYPEVLQVCWLRLHWDLPVLTMIRPTGKESNVYKERVYASHHRVGNVVVQ